jgi:hypothetical protein
MRTGTSVCIGMIAAGLLLGCGGDQGASSGSADETTSTAFAKQQPLSHPGGLHSRSQIAFVRSKLAAGTEPWASGIGELTKLAEGCQNHKPQAVPTLCVYGRYQQPELHYESSRIISKDSACAYWSALAYKLTDKASYASKAIEIMKAWAQTNTGYRFDKECSDTPLAGTHTAVGMILAAELLYHDPKWRAPDRQSFLNWADNVYRKLVRNYYYQKRNKGCWSAFGTVAYLHLKGDVGRIQQVIPDLRKRIDDSIRDSGEMRHETQRASGGLWYSYFALAGLTAAMQIVYEATGTDLFEYRNKRVKKAVDYLLHYCKNPSKWPHHKKSDLLTCTQATWFDPSLLFEAMSSIYGDPAYDRYVAPDRPIAYTNPHHIAWSMPTLMTARVGGTTSPNPPPGPDPAPNPAPSGGAGATVVMDPDHPQHWDFFQFRIKNTSDSLKIKSVALSLQGGGVFDLFEAKRAYTVSPSLGGNNDGVNSASVKLSFANGGLAAGTSQATTRQSRRERPIRGPVVCHDEPRGRDAIHWTESARCQGGGGQSKGRANRRCPENSAIAANTRHDRHEPRTVVAVGSGGGPSRCRSEERDEASRQMTTRGPVAGQMLAEKAASRYVRAASWVGDSLSLRAPCSALA